MRILWVALFWVTLMAAPASACRQALVFALDVSGSVNGVEYQQQVTGLAAALSDPTIRDIILSDTVHPVEIAVFEWSSQNHQLIILPWTPLDSHGAIDQAVARIGAHRKVRAGLKTALGTALGFAQGLLQQRPACWQHTIDVSGDGRGNVGPAPRSVYAAGFERTTVNALVVGNPQAETGDGPGITPLALQLYYEREVILGPGAFSMVAQGYADYARAMRRKLARELQPLNLSGEMDVEAAPG
ncbi:MAG: DUF1194 domain-containing protein [Pseudomonadota bacterium]